MFANSWHDLSLIHPRGHATFGQCQPSGNEMSWHFIKIGYSLFLRCMLTETAPAKMSISCYFEINIIHHRSPMQTEKYQLKGKQIMPETR